MADVTHTKIDAMEAIDGFFEGVKFHKAAAGLDITAFGISIIDLAPGAAGYPEHDHSAEGIGGKMFAKRPEQLGQEEVYVALRGSDTLEVERLGWEEIRGLPVVPDSAIGTGRFRIVCSQELDDAGLEETEAVGRELVETVAPRQN